MPNHLDHCGDHPLTDAPRVRSRSESAWVRSFSCARVRPLIVCRGPIRQEALEIFRQMGCRDAGILLSEKDSIVYPNALAPELRRLRPDQVHQIADYSGGSAEERARRIEEILTIACTFGYTHIFAGYGFMAEDTDFVRAIEQAGKAFIGPCSRTVRAAGQKDEAKRTARRVGVSVTPGVHDVTARTLLHKYPDLEALRRVCEREGLELELSGAADTEALLAGAEQVLAAARAQGVDLFSVEELGEQLRREVRAMLRTHPGARVRLKAVGGGGGKGQRILGLLGAPESAEAEAARAPAMLREILGEVKATAPGDDKNVLIELNIESTRHHEIQLVGNGSWCVSLGGRDCSLQMHEQKLLEFSITPAALEEGIAVAEAGGRTRKAEALREDLATLRRMEAEAERFGEAVGLDSASTFECIVDGSRHYFMEVNTRIQVEHRVSELCYALRFANPEDPTDFFEVDSLVEAMVLLAAHKERLPRPERIARGRAACEARLNATDAALSPHAGGMITSWSSPIEGEIRDDQGICLPNPDTGHFIEYRLAGAYDSNIALLVTHGEDRRAAFVRLREILRAMRLYGTDLHTNLEFHYGLLSWMLAQGVDARPTTRFVGAYLARVGLLKQEADRLHLWHALKTIFARHQERARAALSGDSLKAVLAANAACLNGKQTLVMRPLERLMAEPHLLSGWLSASRGRFRWRGEGVLWLDNPVDVLADLYFFLNMDNREDPAAYVIWDGDRDFLDRSRRFYAEVRRRLDRPRQPGDFPELDACLRDPSPPPGFEPKLWKQVRASHAGMQLGLEALGILPLIGKQAGYWELRVEPDLRIAIPEHLHDPELQAATKRVLAPPVAVRADAIVAASGGMFYAREAPDRPPFVEVGDHFEVGQPLYIIEIMKMFNKVYAPFSGTVEEILVEGGSGTIVAKGQPLFRVSPDEPLVQEDPVAGKEAAKAVAREYVDRLYR